MLVVVVGHDDVIHGECIADKSGRTHNSHGAAHGQNGGKTTIQSMHSIALCAVDRFLGNPQCLDCVSSFVHTFRAAVQHHHHYHTIPTHHIVST